MVLLLYDKSLIWTLMGFKARHRENIYYNIYLYTIAYWLCSPFNSLFSPNLKNKLVKFLYFLLKSKLNKFSFFLQEKRKSNALYKRRKDVIDQIVNNTEKYSKFKALTLLKMILLCKYRNQGQLFYTIHHQPRTI